MIQLHVSDSLVALAASQHSYIEYPYTSIVEVILIQIQILNMAGTEGAGNKTNTCAVERVSDYQF
jgi:hypothetical protein